MRIFPSAPCVTRSSLETESATRVNTLAAKGCFIPIRWAFISAISSGASPTEYARITKRTGTATTANSRMASIPDTDGISRILVQFAWGGDFKDGAANGVDTIYYKPRSIYVGECKDGVPHGNGILYTRIGTISKYYFREGQFENGKLISGFLSNYYGTFPVIGGTTSTGYRKEFSKIDLYSQSELTSKYESLRALKPKKFLGAELTEEQRLFLDKKLSSEQILSIRKSQ